MCVLNSARENHYVDGDAGDTHNNDDEEEEVEPVHAIHEWNLLEVVDLNAPNV